MTCSINLRALEPEDLELVYRIENDAELWQWGASSVPLSRYVVRQYLEQQQADIYRDGQVRLVVEADGHAAGIADLTSFDPRHLRAEVGIVILSEYHRRGIATAALSRLHDYAAQTLHLRSLYAYVATDNQPAQALFRRLGYAEAGRLQRWIDGAHDSIVFQTLLNT